MGGYQRALPPCVPFAGGKVSAHSLQFVHGSAHGESLKDVEPSADGHRPASWLPVGGVGQRMIGPAPSRLRVGERSLVEH